MSLADDIFAVEDRPRVPVEAWGKKLFIVPMGGIERDAYDLELHNEQKTSGTRTNWRARLVVRCLVDENGNRVFTDEQAARLGQKHCDTIQRLFDVATAASKMGGDAEDDAAKNS